MLKTRKTKQKQILLEQICKMDGFFEPIQLLQKVKKIYPKMGIATVYRFLKECEKNEAVQKYRHSRKKIYSAQEKSDAHFTCTICGKMRHIDASSIDFGSVLCDKKNIKISHFQLDVYGTCEKCLLGLQAQ
jgi:Fur family ferric uptake transcriptional regulator